MEDMLIEMKDMGGQNEIQRCGWGEVDITYRTQTVDRVER